MWHIEPPTSFFTPPSICLLFVYLANCERKPVTVEIDKSATHRRRSDHSSLSLGTHRRPFFVLFAHSSSSPPPVFSRSFASLSFIRPARHLLSFITFFIFFFFDHHTSSFDLSKCRLTLFRSPRTLLPVASLRPSPRPLWPRSSVSSCFCKCSTCPSRSPKKTNTKVRVYTLSSFIFFFSLLFRLHVVCRFRFRHATLTITLTLNAVRLVYPTMPRCHCRPAFKVESRSNSNSLLSYLYSLLNCFRLSLVY